jgi:hypothetical protein
LQRENRFQAGDTAAGDEDFGEAVRGHTHRT